MCLLLRHKRVNLSFKASLRKNVENCVQFLQKYTERIWYPTLIGFLAFVDTFIIIIPTDGLLISSAMLKPKSWFNLALCISVGSTVGGMIFFHLIQKHGLPWILEIYPGINSGPIWAWSETFFLKYGLLLVFIVAATPIIQQPAIIFASLAHTPFLPMMFVVFLGRFLKNIIMAYISSHSPRLISKMWGVQDELDEVGIHIGSPIHRNLNKDST